MADPTPHVLPKIVLLLILNACLVFAQQKEKLISQNPCSSKPTCHECIQMESCAWCYDPNYDDKPRCFEPALGKIIDEEQCMDQYTFNPVNAMGIEQRKALTRAKGLSGVLYNIDGSWNYSQPGNGHFLPTEIVQVAPQRINLQLRARQPYTISMSYTQAEEYPVDLYYIVDLSKSMQDHKEKLSLLGDKLAETLQNITSNFRIGFGSFVGKGVTPKVSTLQEKLKHPCPDCGNSYGFRNHMSLSSDAKLFSKTLKEALKSGILGGAEGSLDAIMQAVACKEQIGWREKARRLLIFSTNAGFQIVDDGKLRGIMKHNDGDCQLDEFGYYKKFSEQDHPSVEQINAKVRENSINVIFAVTSDQIPTYQQLQKNIEGASIATLSTDSSNIVELIKEQYEKISSKIELKHNASQYVNIIFFSKCLNSSGKLINTNECDQIKVGDLVEFKIQIKVVKCPTNHKEWRENIQIYPIGVNERLIINLDMVCDCLCEHPGHPAYQEKSPKCFTFGTYKCGICDCVSGAFGKHCECAVNVNDTGCILPWRKSTQVCSGRGKCICGQCECDRRESGSDLIYGEYCECDNFSCERHNGLQCGGNGYCNCGKCVCNMGWYGSDCSCPSTTSTCINPQTKGRVICSERGQCECGECKCHVGADIEYSGKYCELETSRKNSGTQKSEPSIILFLKLLSIFYSF